MTLKNIPNDWELKKLKDVSEFSNGKGHEKSIDENGKYIVVNSKFISTNGRVKKFSNQNLSPLKFNDITMVMSDIPNGKAIAKCFIIDEDKRYTLNQRICSIQSNEECDNKFLYYVINRNRYYLAFDNGDSQTNLKKNEVLDCPIQFPPLLEQQKIADILSTVDAKIEVIDQQITETEELKKGLMQRLLTKGLGHTEFKDSPLGEIPKIWEVKKLKEFARCFVGIASSATHAYRDYGIMLLRNQNIKSGKLSLDDVLYVDELYELQHKSKRLIAGDILTVRTGYPGVSAVVPPELEGQQSFTTLITRIKEKEISSDFVCAFINSDMGKSFFISSQAGGAQKNVGSKTLENLLVPIPSINEQIEINDIIMTISEKHNILIEKKVYYHLAN
jgi:type I restriction enzyme S subunit